MNWSILLFLGPLLMGQQPNPAPPPVKWSATTTTLANGQIEVRIQATIDEDWHVYALTLDRDDGPLPTEIRFEESKSYRLEGRVREQPPDVGYDPNFAMDVRSHAHRAVFTQLITPASKPPFHIACEVEYMACNDKMCLPPVVVPMAIDVPASTPSEVR